MNHKLIFISAFGLFSGCANYSYDYRFTDLTPSFKVVDNRSEDEKSNYAAPSFKLEDCSYGIFKLGDGQVTPNRIAYLRDRLASQENERLFGKTVEINHFAIYNNYQSATRLAAGSVMGPSAIPTLLNSYRISNACVADENTPGGFTASENPGYDPAIVTEITVRIDGALYSTRKVTPYLPSRITGLDPKFIKISVDAAIQDLISRFGF